MTQIKTKEQAEQYLVLIERRGKALQKGKQVILEQKIMYENRKSIIFLKKSRFSIM